MEDDIPATRRAEEAREEARTEHRDELAALRAEHRRDTETLQAVLTALHTSPLQQATRDAPATPAKRGRIQRRNRPRPSKKQTG